MRVMQRWSESSVRASPVSALGATSICQIAIVVVSTGEEFCVYTLNVTRLS